MPTQEIPHFTPIPVLLKKGMFPKTVVGGIKVAFGGVVLPSVTPSGQRSGRKISLPKEFRTDDRALFAWFDLGRRFIIISTDERDDTALFTSFCGADDGRPFATELDPRWFFIALLQGGFHEVKVKMVPEPVGFVSSNLHVPYWRSGDLYGVPVASTVREACRTVEQVLKKGGFRADFSEVVSAGGYILENTEHELADGEGRTNPDGSMAVVKGTLISPDHPDKVFEQQANFIMRNAMLLDGND